MKSQAIPQNILNFNMLQFLMPEDSCNEGEGWGGGGDIAHRAFLTVGWDTSPCWEFPPQLPWSSLGRSCTDETSLSGSKETLYQVPDCLAGQWEVSSSLSIHPSACRPWWHGFMKPPVLKSTQAEDSTEDSAFVPVKGYSPGTRNED